MILGTYDYFNKINIIIVAVMRKIGCRVEYKRAFIKTTKLQINYAR